MPRVSIGLPVYNGERFLAEALDSLRNQTFDDLEILVVDNASTDASADIVHDAMRDDGRIAFHRQDRNLGAAANYRYAFVHTRGELFKWCAHDDVCAPDLVRACVAELDRRGPSAVLAFPRTRVIDERGATVEEEEGPLPWRGAPRPRGRIRDLLDDPHRSLLHQCTPVMGVVRRDALARTRLIQPFNGSDDVLLFHLALLGDYAEVPEHLFFRRWHAATSLAANRTPESVAAWFDPEADGRFPMPRTRRLRGYLRAIHDARLPLREAMACYGEVARWTARHGTWRVVAGEARIKWRERAARPRR